MQSDISEDELEHQTDKYMKQLETENKQLQTENKQLRNKNQEHEITIRLLQDQLEEEKRKPNPTPITNLNAVNVNIGCSHFVVYNGENENSETSSLASSAHGREYHNVSFPESFVFDKKVDTTEKASQAALNGYIVDPDQTIYEAETEDEAGSRSRRGSLSIGFFWLAIKAITLYCNNNGISIVEWDRVPQEFSSCIEFMVRCCGTNLDNFLAELVYDEVDTICTSEIDRYEMTSKTVQTWLRFRDLGESTPHTLMRIIARHIQK